MKDREQLEYEVIWQDGAEEIKTKTFPTEKKARTYAIMRSLKHEQASMREWQIEAHEGEDQAIQVWRFNTGTELDHVILSEAGEVTTRPTKKTATAAQASGAPEASNKISESSTQEKEDNEMATKSKSKKTSSKKVPKNRAIKRAPVRKASVKSVSVAFSGKKPSQSSEKIIESFASREGSIRHKMIKAMAANPGVGVKVEKLLNACYGSGNLKNRTALNMVIAGARKTIQKEGLPFVIHVSSAEGTIGIYAK